MVRCWLLVPSQSLSRVFLRFVFFFASFAAFRRAMRHSEVAEPKDSTSASPFELQVLRPDSRSPSLVMSLYDVSSCATCIGAEAMLQVSSIV